MNSAESKPVTKELGARILLAAAIVVMVAIRAHRLDLPLERDEGEYAYGGQLVLAGDFSYEALRTLKLPGMHLVSGAAFALLGETKQALHAALLLASVATTIFTFLAVRRLWTERFAATAASSVALLGVSQTLLGLAAHSEAFALACAAAGTWLLLVAQASRRWLIWIASGLAFGLAIFMKQPAAVLVALALGSLVVGARGRSGPARIAVWLFAAATPYALVCTWMLSIGGFDAFWTSTMTYARSYVSDTTWRRGLELLGSQGLAFLRFEPGFAALFVLGLVSIVVERSGRSRAWLMGAVLCAGILAASPGFYFRSHYFIFALPGIAIVIAAGTEALGRRIGTRAGIASFAAASVLGLVLERRVLFLDESTWVATQLYHPNPFVEAERIAGFLREKSRPDDTIAILGSEPEIAFLANRRSATGYVYMYPLMEVHGLARSMQEQAIREIEGSDPRFLVLVNVSMSWLQKSASEMLLLEWFARTTRSKYRVVAVCDLVGPGRSHWTEGAESSSYRPMSKNYVTIFERRP